MAEPDENHDSDYDSDLEDDDDIDRRLYLLFEKF